MKQNILRIFIFMISCFMCCSCYAGAGEKIKKFPGHEPGNPPKKTEVFVNKEVSAFLGERLTVIRDADKAEAYQIDWSQKAAQMIQGYPVADRRDLSTEQIRSLKQLIFSPASYEFQWDKRTRVRPSYMLRLIRGGDAADIAADLNSRQWAFYYRGHIAEEDISDSAMPVLSGILDSLFNK